MKKFSIFIIAATLAIGFSAFTTAKPVGTFYYRNSNNNPTEYDGPDCGSGTVNPCTKFLDGADRQIYTDLGCSIPVKWGS